MRAKIIKIVSQLRMAGWSADVAAWLSLWTVGEVRFDAAIRSIARIKRAETPAATPSPLALF